jgi:hypothetical protein
MNVEIGPVAAQFLFWNICFKFSVLVLCSVQHILNMATCECILDNILKQSKRTSMYFDNARPQNAAAWNALIPTAFCFECQIASN